MTGALLAFLAVLLSGLGARDQLTLAGVARQAGPRPALLLAGLIATLATAAFAGWAASVVAPTLNGNARLFLAAIALLLASGEALFLSPRRDAAEPTQSLPALLAVLTIHQMTDAARFLIFGVGLATQPLPAAVGGAAGGIMLLGAAWSAPEYFTWQRLRLPRRCFGLLTILPAIYLGLSAMGRT